MKHLFSTFALLVLGLSPASAVNYAGNGGTGFGGVVSSLDITNTPTDITFTLNRGPGTLSDRLVIYIDSVGGGFGNTGGFTDTGSPAGSDQLRAALSGVGTGGGSSVVTFPEGMTADYGIGLEGGFAGLWTLTNGGSHGFVATANAAPGGTSQASYAMTVSLANLGLSVGSTLQFVGTYLNSGNAFRSNEGIGDGLPGANLGQAPATFTAFRTYTVVPEPSSAVLSLLGLLAVRRRRN